VERLFASFVAAALSHPTVLLRQIDARLILHRSESVSCVDAEQRVVLGLPWVFEGEQELLEQRRQLIAPTVSFAESSFSPMIVNSPMLLQQTYKVNLAQPQSYDIG
jgi:hypothetical protein